MKQEVHSAKCTCILQCTDTTFKRVQLENWYYATFFKIHFFQYYYSVNDNGSNDVSDLRWNRGEVPPIISWSHRCRLIFPILLFFCSILWSYIKFEIKNTRNTTWAWNLTQNQCEEGCNVCFKWIDSYLVKKTVLVFLRFSRYYLVLDRRMTKLKISWSVHDITSVTRHENKGLKIFPNGKMY